MAQAERKMDKTAVLGMIAMGIAVIVIANDFTSLTVALPTMEREFATDITTVQWVINGYALVFGVLIVSGGRLADMFGRRRIFFVGAAIFAGFSLIGGLAPNVAVLLSARAIMGIGGALMWPAILGMTFSLLPKNKAGLAGGLILGAAGFGNAVGPLIGGVLTETLGWRWIFFLNLPVAAFAVFVTWFVVARDKPSDGDQRIDYRGVATLSIGLFALLLALDQGIDLGWSNPYIIALFALCVALLVAFAFIERAAGAMALVPGDVVTTRVFVAGCLATLMMSALFFGALLFLPQFMSKVLGFSAIQSGAGLLPVMGTFAVTSFIAGPLYERLGAKLAVSAGAAMLGLGILLLSTLTASTSYVGLVPGMVVLGIGIGLFYSSVTTASITALDESRSSLAGGIVYMFQIAGGSIGLGINTAIVVTAPSLAEGIHRAFLIDAMVAAVGLVIAVLFIGGKVDKERLRSLIHHHRGHG
jgi:EmrB/QacA subfamily drug resistance transporter